MTEAHSMTPTRAAIILPALVLVLTGCGAVSTLTLRATTGSVASADAAPHIPAVTPAPTSPATPAPIVPVTPPAATTVATVPGTGGSVSLEILNGSGVVIAKTAVNPTQFWMTAAGPGGAYWAEDGVEHELTASGAVHALGAIPADANGVVISPDGTSYAYATSDQLSNGTTLNRISVVRPGAAAAVIADRVSDPNHPTADAPESWDYYLVSWTADGIAFARVPTGGCGCGSFDMQMQSANSGIINPTTEVVTALTNDDFCPLSNVGPAAETVCFATSATSEATQDIRIASHGVATHSYSLSGTSVAGDAVFAPGGNALAYITIPVSQDGCGATITPTLRILNLTSGSAIDRNVGDFAPAAWGSNGLLYGLMTVGSTNWVASVNPVTFAVSRVSPSVPGATFIGIV
jgi:hypothetical protein